MEAVTPENTRKHPFRVSPDSLRTPENTLSPFRGRVKTGVGTGPGVWVQILSPGAKPKPGAKAMNAARTFALLVPYLLAAPPATIAALALGLLQLNKDRNHD